MAKGQVRHLGRRPVSHQQGQGVREASGGHGYAGVPLQVEGQAQRQARVRHRDPQVMRTRGVGLCASRRLGAHGVRLGRRLCQVLHAQGALRRVEGLRHKLG